MGEGVISFTCKSTLIIMTFRIELVADSTVKLTKGDGIYTVEVLPLFDVDCSVSKEFLNLEDAEDAFDSIVDKINAKLLYL